jgi:transcription elongation regulator 1
MCVLCGQVRSSDASWSDTRRNLRKDHRWESASLLERDDKEKLFNEHVETLSKKKKENFRQLLDETVMVRGNEMGTHCSPSERAADMKVAS